MKIIAIEGIDGSGKATIAAKIATWARENDLRVQVCDFPRYGTDFVDNLVVPFILRPAKDEPLTYDISVRNAKLFSDDRIDWMRNYLEAGDIVDTLDILVLDRFSASNIAYQSALLSESPIDGRIATVIRNYERSEGVLEPDITVLLPVDPELALVRRRTRQSAEEDDLYESKADLQQKVWENYLLLAGHHDNWMISDDVEEILRVAALS